MARSRAKATADSSPTSADDSAAQVNQDAPSAPQVIEGDIVEVHENVLNLHGFFRVDNLTDEGIVVAALDGSHQRMRVAPESIGAIFRSL